MTDMMLVMEQERLAGRYCRNGQAVARHSATSGRAGAKGMVAAHGGAGS